MTSFACGQRSISEFAKAATPEGPIYYRSNCNIRTLYKRPKIDLVRYFRQDLQDVKYSVPNLAAQTVVKPELTEWLTNTMRPRSAQPVVLLLIILTVPPSWLAAQHSTGKIFQRAKLPDFDNVKPSNFFFRNAFAEALQGTRPANLGRPAIAPVTTPPDSTTESVGTQAEKYAWSKIISATTIEDEIKAIKLAIDQTVTTPQKYRDGGFRKGRVYFSVLALLFAIVHDYDDEVRWQKDAAHARDRFAQVGRTSKVGSSQAYNQAAKRKDDLNELVLGASLPGTETQALPTAWDQVCDRPPLMNRLKESFQERISPWASSATEFRKHADDILHEAELMAAISKAMHQEGFDLADDDGYVSYCQQLQQAASSLAAAVRRKDPQAGRQAAGQIDKACNDCHGDYR